MPFANSEVLKRLCSLKHWQVEDKACSVRDMALNRDRTAMLLDNLLHDTQSQASAIDPCREEWVEDVWEILRHNPMP